MNSLQPPEVSRLTDWSCHIQRGVVDITQRIPPNIEPDLLGQRGKVRRFYLWRFKRLHMMDNFQTTHVDDNPEDVGLPHEEGQDTPVHGTEATQKTRAGVPIHSGELGAIGD